MYTFEQIHNYLIGKVNKLPLKTIKDNTCLPIHIIKRLDRMMLNLSINNLYLGIYDTMLTELSKKYDIANKEDSDELVTIINKFDECNLIRWYLIDLIKEKKGEQRLVSKSEN